MQRLVKNMQQNQYIRDIKYLLGLNDYIYSCMQIVNRIKNQYNIAFDYCLSDSYVKLQKLFLEETKPAIESLQRDIKQNNMIPRDINEHYYKILETIRLSNFYQKELNIQYVHGLLDKNVTEHFELLDKLLEKYLNKTNITNFNKEHYNTIVKNLQNLVKTIGGIGEMELSARGSLDILKNLHNKIEEFEYNIQRFHMMNNDKINIVNRKYNYRIMDNQEYNYRRIKNKKLLPLTRTNINLFNK